MLSDETESVQCHGSKSDNRIGVRKRRQDPNYGEVVHGRFTSSGPSRTK